MLGWRQVLAGSGVYDGSEVHEASACLAHLSRAGATVQCYAPNVKQMHVIDHSKVLAVFSTGIWLPDMFRHYECPAAARHVGRERPQSVPGGLGV